jgi:hypothetical protein
MVLKTLGRYMRRFVRREFIRGKSTNLLWIPLLVSPTIAKKRRLPKAFPKIPDTMPESQQENGPPGQSPGQCRAAAAARERGDRVSSHYIGNTNQDPNNLSNETTLFHESLLYMCDIYCRIMGDYLAAICFHTISIITYEKQILEQSNVSPLCQFCKADVSGMCWLNIRWAGVQGPGLLDV